MLGYQEASLWNVHISHSSQGVPDYYCVLLLLLSSRPPQIATLLASLTAQCLVGGEKLFPPRFLAVIPRMCVCPVILMGKGCDKKKMFPVPLFVERAVVGAVLVACLTGCVALVRSVRAFLVCACMMPLFCC